MAKPIREIKVNKQNPMEEQADSLNEIISLIAKNKESITTALEIIQELNSAGLLDMIKGLLKTRNKVGVLVIDQLNQPSMHRTIKNSMQAIQLFGKLDSDKLNILLNASNRGLEYATDHDEKLSKWGLIKSLNDPNVMSSISTMMSFLKGMGKELNTQNPLH